MAPSQDELDALRHQVAVLTARIFRLEQKLGIAAEAPRPEAAVPSVQPPVAAPLPEISRAIPTSGPQTTEPPSFATVGSTPRTGNLESKIGKLWLNWIGIIAILFGAGFFIQYAYAKDMIGARGLVAIGIIFGISIVLGSEWFRKRGRAFFSYSLKAVGIGILYTSLWGAHYYKLVPVEVVFGAMIVVTAATVVMAVNQDAQLLAFYALIGGFLSPVLVSTGNNQEVVLFIYVGILDLGVLALAVLKPWRRLLWGSFIGTVILYCGWASEYYSISQRFTTLMFTILFGAIFASIPLATPYTRSTKFPGPSITLTLLPLFNAAAFFLALYGMYEEETAKLTWFALGLAAVYLGISNVFMRRFAEKDTRKIVALLHVAIAISFITIAVPLKLNANWITIGWLVESAVLLWISEKTKTGVLRYLGIAALALGIFRVFVFDSEVTATRLIFNARFATYAVAIAVLGGIIILGSLEAEKAEPGKAKIWPIRLAGIMFSILVLVGLTLEAADYFERQYLALTTNGGDYTEVYARIQIAQRFSYSVIWLLYGAALMVTGFWKRSAFVRWQALVLIAVTILKIFTYDSSQLNMGYRILSFIALGVVLLATSYAYQRDWLKLSSKTAEKPEQGSSASA